MENGGPGTDAGRPSPHHHDHGERDHRGWRVSPGPEGRGKPPPTPTRFPWRLVVFMLRRARVQCVAGLRVPREDRAGPNSLQPSLPSGGQDRQRQVDRLARVDGRGESSAAPVATCLPTSMRTRRPALLPRCQPSRTQRSSRVSSSPRASSSTPSRRPKAAPSARRCCWASCRRF